MALKDLFTSRLFGGKRKSEETAEEASVEEQAVEEEELPPEKTPPPQLDLQPDHPLNRLWHSYAGGEDLAPPLILETPPDAPTLSEKEIPQELSRLERLVRETAQKRLAMQAANPAPTLDAEVQVFVLLSRMTAWILVYPPYGKGKQVDREMMEETLLRFRVRYGIDEELLDRLPDLPDRYFHLFPVAQGDPPIHGEDGHIIDLFSRNPTQTIKEDESGRVDFASVEIFQNVKKGEVICRIIPPTPCIPGRSVADTAVPGRAGQAPTVPKGRNTEISEDGEALIASRDGHVEFSGRNFLVKPVLDIGGNVDFSTGNINCLGDIHIHGDVISGFTVRATGTITVDGVVEACTIEAGGDLIVRKGVQGNKQAVLRAHRSIYARYLENCSVYARENLEAECIISCDVYSDGAVTVRSGRGAIIGGQIRAADVISVNVMGARSGCRTGVFLGGRPCEEFERESLTREILGMEAELEKVSRQPDSPAKLRQMSKLRVMISANKMKLQQFDKELEQSDPEPEESGEEQDESPKQASKPNLNQEPKKSNSRLVCSTLYPGAEITIGHAFLRVSHETRMCTARLKGNEISLQ